MSAVDDFINFVLNHPGYYHVAKSRVFMLVLEFVCSGTRSALDLYEKFKQFEKSDLDQMVQALVSLGLAQVQARGSGQFFACTVDGHSLVEKVSKSKQELLVSSD